MFFCAQVLSVRQELLLLAFSRGRPAGRGRQGDVSDSFNCFVLLVFCSPFAAVRICARAFRKPLTFWPIFQTEPSEQKSNSETKFPPRGRFP